MAAKKKSKVVHYARARMAVPPAPDLNLQQLVNSAFRKLTTMSERTVLGSDGAAIQPRHQRLRTSSFGSLFHLASYTTQEAATTVPHPVRDEDEGDLDAAAPPSNAEYMDGEAFLLIRNNDVVVCSTNLADSRVCWYFDKLISKARSLEKLIGLSMSRIANLDTLKMIEEFGVRSITLNAHLYEASLSAHRRKSKRRTLLGPLLAEIAAMASIDASVADANADADLQARVTIRVGKGQGTIAAAGLSELARSVVTDESNLDDLQLELGNGCTLAASRVSLTKTYSIRALNKGLHYSEAFDALDHYFDELKVHHLLET